MRQFLCVLFAFAGQPATAEVPKVVTDIPPVYALVAQVMGDLGQPILLLEKGADEHDFQLRPSQMQVIADAGLVVWIGPELTPWLTRALDAGSEARQLALLSDPETRVLSYPKEHGHEEGAHDHDGIDPHAWLNPENASIWTDLIAAELALLDPENASIYVRNAGATKDKIAQLDAELGQILAPLKSAGFVTYHQAYGYFAAHYGLAYLGAVASGDAATPGAERLVELQAELRAGEVICAFPEAQHDPGLLEQILDSTTVRMGGAIDPVGSSLEPTPQAYETLLRQLATTVSDCLKG
ncbi:MAG: zinc ABC transporter substrate-binding protein [Microgenomates group bacterium]